ncbi:MAG: hypothetical protein VXZ78_06860, partial [Pseudomonadota bacterium]|nr:hypothetical protein [Pseudomonadota bacterium]
ACICCMVSAFSDMAGGIKTLDSTIYKLRALELSVPVPDVEQALLRDEEVVRLSGVQNPEQPVDVSTLSQNGYGAHQISLRAAGRAAPARA